MRRNNTSLYCTWSIVKYYINFNLYKKGKFDLLWSVFPSACGLEIRSTDSPHSVFIFNAEYIPTTKECIYNWCILNTRTETKTLYKYINAYMYTIIDSYTYTYIHTPSYIYYIYREKERDTRIHRLAYKQTFKLK